MKSVNSDDVPVSVLHSVKIFVLLIVFFSIFAHTVGDNENSRFNTAAALVENHEITIDEFHNNTNDKAYIDGNYYSDKPPLPSYLAVPSYFMVYTYMGDNHDNESVLKNSKRELRPRLEWGRYFAIVSVSAVAGSLTAVIIYLLSLNLGLSKSRSIVLSLISGLGTLIFPYSTTFHGTMLGSFFMLLAAYLWVKEDFLSDKKYTFLIALLFGLGVSSSYLIIIPGAVLLILNSAFQIKSFEVHLYGILGLFLGLIPLLAFNYFATGNPFEPTLFSKISSDPLSAETTIFELTPPTLILAKFIRGLFSPLTGLLIYTPILFFSLLGLKNLYYNSKKLFSFVTATFFFNLLFISYLPLSLIRTFYGPRYLLPSSLVLMIPFILYFRESKNSRMFISYLFALASSLIMLASSQPWISSLESSPVNFQVHIDKMTAFGIFQNKLGEYLVSIGSQGLQSPILSYLLGVSNDFHTVLGPYQEHQIKLGALANKILVYDIRFFTLISLFLISFIIFRKEILKSVFNSSEAIKIGFIALFVIMAGFTVKDVHKQGWYDQRGSDYFEWGRETPVIYFTSSKDEEKKLQLEIKSVTQNNVRFVFNGEKIDEFNIGENLTKLETTITARKGLNKLEMYSHDGCKILGEEIDNNDVRCVTVGLAEINISSS